MRAAGGQLDVRRLPGLARFAREERLTKPDAVFRLIQFAHFHRAAELRLGHAIPATKLIGRVCSSGAVDEDLCLWLAKSQSSAEGPAWAAAAYSALVMADERRDRGQFFTSEPIARAMADWAIRSKDSRVLDPGCGPGQLLASAHRRLVELGARNAASHLVGVEISILAPTFAALAMTRSGASPRMLCADFLTSYRVRPKSFDAAIANPPYSRHHTLSAGYKQQIGKLADRLTGRRVHRSAGVYVHFLLRSVQLLKEGGRLAFLTPREFFDVRYGAAVKAHLLACTRIRALVVFDPAATAAFEGVRTTSAITLLERGKPDRQPVRIIHAQRMPTARQLKAALAARRRLGKRSWGWIEDVSYDRVAREPRWSSLLHAHHSGLPQRGHVRLGELVKVTRGIATGANHFFVLSKAEADANGLKNGSLRPAIGRAKLVQTERITGETFERWSAAGERVWLLDIRHKKLTAAERSYLKRGVDHQLDERTLCRTREPWYRMERRDSPPILVTYMSKSRPRFLRNDAKLVPLNVFHGLYPKSLTRRQVKRLCDYLSSPAFRTQLLRGVRMYGAGLVKIEPRELENLVVPDFRRRTG